MTKMTAHIWLKTLKKARHIYPSLVLVQPRKTHPCLTERLLMGRKESNQSNKQNPLKTFISRARRPGTLRLGM